MKSLTRLLTALMAAGLILFVAGCEKSTGDHLEDAGDSISKAADKAGDAVGDAVEDAGDSVEDAADKAN
ncbi:YtxH domain-containing protein [Ruficoccus amylovorans]|uniref:YtxH domain-containing protein n=1 Tax=Ruficoccus amylovorans TaxID=1804625 RepID=A0A842HLR8_9BACT|nr:YtxH domain-containing protein [Ruficoccus amylovorans]MBC2596407.1 YtxH domain-containing protein [Ruficoccus amylovorans]